MTKEIIKLLLGVYEDIFEEGYETPPSIKAFQNAFVLLKWICNDYGSTAHENIYDEIAVSASEDREITIQMWRRDLQVGSIIIFCGSDGTIMLMTSKKTKKYTTIDGLPDATMKEIFNEYILGES